MRFKELRTKNKLTQKEIAEKLGITQFTYSNYENLKTQPDIQILKDLANFYKVSLDYLLENENKNDFDYNNLSDIKKECVQIIASLTEQNSHIAFGYLTHILQTQKK